MTTMPPTRFDADATDREDDVLDAQGADAAEADAAVVLHAATDAG